MTVFESPPWALELAADILDRAKVSPGARTEIAKLARAMRREAVRLDDDAAQGARINGNLAP